MGAAPLPLSSSPAWKAHRLSATNQDAHAAGAVHRSPTSFLPVLIVDDVVDDRLRGCPWLFWEHLAWARGLREEAPANLDVDEGWRTGWAPGLNAPGIADRAMSFDFESPQPAQKDRFLLANDAGQQLKAVLIASLCLAGNQAGPGLPQVFPHHD